MLDLIIGRRSPGALVAPAPTEAQLDLILRAAASVPDHGKLRPYRFVVVRGDARQRFGEALSAAAVSAGADDITIAVQDQRFGIAIQHGLDFTETAVLDLFERGEDGGGRSAVAITI